MANVDCRVISFKQSPKLEEHIYLLSQRALQMGDYYYDRSMGRFACVQRVLHKSQLLTTCPKIEATSSDGYPSIKSVPTAFKQAYFAGGKTIKSTQLRID